MSSSGNDFGKLLRCPVCGNNKLLLRIDRQDWATCPLCHTTYELLHGIPSLIRPDVLQRICGPRPNDWERATVSSDEFSVKWANAFFHDQSASDYEHDGNQHYIFLPEGACQRRIRQTLARASQLSNRGALLDVCCGTGNILTHAREVFDVCIGIDISINMMNIASQRNLNVLFADACDIPFQDGSVDCVTAFSSLHHILDYTTVVSEMARVLKPGGTFYSDWDPNGRVRSSGWAVSLAVKFLKAWHSFTAKSNAASAPEVFLAEFHHHFGQGFDGNLIVETLKKANFKDVRLIYHFNPSSFDTADSWGGQRIMMACLKTISFIPPTARNVMPWVSVLATK